MYFVADLHIHSKYSRATSKEMDVENLDRYARMKGIKLLGTGDFTHPGWLRELKGKLEPAGPGLFKYGQTHFMLTAEVNNNFTSGGKGKRVHNLIFAPDFGVVDEINERLQRYGDLAADGRPNLNLSARDLVKLVLGVSEDCLIVPAHAWTPWFSLFGANSGFDSVEECFRDQTENIYALETGLSSDPAMNWRLSSLDRFALISNSDAHSPTRIGREANVFDLPMDYYAVLQAIKQRDGKGFPFTIEFFPQEGKYHYDGHRRCQVRLSPRESKQNYNLCPICRRKLTVGVMHRIESLANRPEGVIPPGAIPGRHLVPLEKIIAEALGKGVGTAAVNGLYEKLTQRLGTEFDILLNLPREELLQVAPQRVVEGIIRVRGGKVDVLPGYDGVYGQVSIFAEEKPEEAQMNLF